MKIFRIYYHPQFRRSFLGLPADIQKIAKKKIILFKNNPFAVSLKTHKLHGKLKNHWSFTKQKSLKIILNNQTLNTQYRHSYILENIRMSIADKKTL